jgi:acyl-coenzyme A thioesterase PaaI-like protein
MWQRLGNRPSAPLLRLLCAMTMSSGVVGFLARQDTNVPGQHSYDRLSKIFLSSPNGSSFVTKCDDEAAPRRKEVESYFKMKLPTRGQFDGHAIFGVLLGENKIESYDVYQRPIDSNEENVIIAHVKLGDRMDGHPGVVHGGILSLIFDDALGFGYEAVGVKKAVTANLNVDFRSPVLAGTHIRVVAQLEHREGRKLFWKAQMTSMDEETLYAEASSLYIVPRSHE